MARRQIKTDDYEGGNRRQFLDRSVVYQWILSLICATLLPVLGYVFIFSGVVSQVEANQLLHEKREEAIAAVPVIESKIENLDKAVAKVGSDVQQLSDKIDRQYETIMNQLIHDNGVH